MADSAEVMRYYSASVGDLRPLRISAFRKRYERFCKAHEQHLKFEAVLAGAKFKTT